MGERFEAAAIAIFLSGVLDGLDGRVARLTRSTSQFGIEFDSLSDLVAFGVAPAILAFQWALAPFGRLGWLAAFMFVVCGALRLARFNVQKSVEDPNYFKGLPIPAAACFIASFGPFRELLGRGSGDEVPSHSGDDLSPFLFHGQHRSLLQLQEAGSQEPQTVQRAGVHHPGGSGDCLQTHGDAFFSSCFSMSRPARSLRFTGFIEEALLEEKWWTLQGHGSEAAR